MEIYVALASTLIYAVAAHYFGMFWPTIIFLLIEVYEGQRHESWINRNAQSCNNAFDELSVRIKKLEAENEKLRERLNSDF